MAPTGQRRIRGHTWSCGHSFRLTSIIAYLILGFDFHDFQRTCGNTFTTLDTGFCKSRSIGRHIYEAGSIETLIRIVDINGGFTIIPEMHLPFLSDAQRENVRPIEGNYVSKREISIYIRKDFIRHGILKSVVKTLLLIIPRKMVDTELYERIGLSNPNA